MLYLKKAGTGDTEKEYLFVRDIPTDENGFTNCWNNIKRDDYEKTALKAMNDFSKGENLPDGYVPETFLFLWDNDEIIGQFRIRHHLCPSLIEGAGHIGYFIDKKYRGKGYAKKGLQMTIREAEKLVPENELYLRVNKDNTASLHVMLSCNGYIHHEDNEKYYVRISLRK